MKSMLYVGATLMIGASIYGFADYKQTHKRKEFKEMYTEKKEILPAVPAAKEKEKVISPALSTKEKKAAVKTKPVAGNKKVAADKEIIIAVQPIEEKDKITTEKKILPKEPEATIKPSEENNVVKTVKKKKIRKEFFSRGRIIEEKEPLIEKPVKKEEKKTESKEL